MFRAYSEAHIRSMFVAVIPPPRGQAEQVLNAEIGGRWNCSQISSFAPNTEQHLGLRSQNSQQKESRWTNSTTGEVYIQYVWIFDWNCPFNWTLWEQRFPATWYIFCGLFHEVITSGFFFFKRTRLQIHITNSFMHSLYWCISKT